MPNFLETIFAQLQRSPGRVVLREIHAEQFVSVTIIYTSGTSGEPKGVCLTTANLTHMLSCTTERLDQLMGQTREPDRVFHWAPFNFAASWILLLSCLSRESVLTLSTDLTKLADEIRLSAPHYFLNVPTLLERVRRGVEDALSKRAAPIRSLYAKARAAWQRQNSSRARTADALWLALGRKLIFSKIKERFGPHLRALICGSAPLAPETHQFFLMLGIPVLQAYGLTETTAICTLDDPRGQIEPGYVGQAIRGIEMKAAGNEEIVVRGPHIFSGYWNRPEETARVLRDGWFHTGDQGEVNLRGNWRIIGRLKNLIILNSGHNVPPEPIEDKIGRETLADLEKFAAAIPALVQETAACIISSARKQGFSAGADLRELYRGAEPLSEKERLAGVRRFLERIHSVLNTIDAAPFVTIAAVHGVCFGGGFELALTCDLIIADKMARFAFPELRLGLIPGFGGIPRLKRDLGNAFVRDLLLDRKSVV